MKLETTSPIVKDFTKTFGGTPFQIPLGPLTVVITHNVAIGGMADRVLHLADGRITRVDANARKLTPSELSW